MDFASSDTRQPAGGPPASRPSDIPAGIPLTTGRITSVKIVVAGGFGAGKTTLVTSVSEIEPLSTEALMTEASVGVDDTDATPGKRSTTVAMDFGRISLESDLVLFLFGTPGQGRYWFMWDDLARGAVGAVVLADTRRLSDSFPVVDYFEGSGLPFVVAVNQFEGAPVYSPEAVRDALDLSDRTPILLCDVRDRSSALEVLTAVVAHALAQEDGEPALL